MNAHDVKTGRARYEPITSLSAILKQFTESSERNGLVFLSQVDKVCKRRGRRGSGYGYEFLVVLHYLLLIVPRIVGSCLPLRRWP